MWINGEIYVEKGLQASDNSRKIVAVDMVAFGTEDAPWDWGYQARRHIPYIWDRHSQSLRANQGYYRRSRPGPHIALALCELPVSGVNWTTK